MKFYSTNNKQLKYSFKDAVVKGLAPDKGLFMPENLPMPCITFQNNLSNRSLEEIGFEVASLLIENEIPRATLKDIVEDALNFQIPLVHMEEDVYSLELFHGPTCAFKDVGARFMARCLGYFTREMDKKITILVATSGDTGSAVANGFYGIDGIDVVILYPSGKVSPLQEKQLTTLDGNVTALEVKGTFDDCQRMVKSAFMDEELKKKVNITSANSINIARLIPQSFYYFHALSQLDRNDKPIVFSVPSGNFGNLTGGLIAKRMGLNIHQMIASTNMNKIVPDYLDTGDFNPKPSIQTISNAMDVGNPSNFDRMKDMYNGSLDEMQKDITGFFYTDDETRTTIRDVYSRTGYVLDPHSAIAYAGLKKYKKGHDVIGIILETAHPGKFADIVSNEIGRKVNIPDRLKEYELKVKKSVLINPDHEELKSFLINRK